MSVARKYATAYGHQQVAHNETCGRVARKSLFGTYKQQELSVRLELHETVVCVSETSLLIAVAKFQSILTLSSYDIGADLRLDNVAS